MACTLADLAQLVSGSVRGALEIPIESAAPLGLAGPRQITLIDTSDKALKLAQATPAAAAVVPCSLLDHEQLPPTLPLLAVDDIHLAFSAIVRHFRPVRESRAVGVHAAARVSPSARIATGVTIHAGATVEDDCTIEAGTTIYPGVYLGPGCRIGRDVTIFPNCVLYENTILHDRVILHANVVLGGYGFGYKQVEGRHVLTPQLGYVEIFDDVEIGAGSTVDRGTYGPTVIGEGTKLDDQVMVGHNCRLGRHNLLCSQVGIAGSTTTGDYVVMAGQVGVRDHLHIADHAVLGAKAGIMHDVPEKEQLVGIPAHPLQQWKLQQVCIAKLPDMRHQLKHLERQMAVLQAALAAAVNRHAA